MISSSDVLRYIRRYVQANQMPPTQGEIAVHFGVSESTVRRRLLELRGEGLVEMPTGRRRALRVPGGKARRHEL